jgi:methionyl aminopeptidase
MLTKTEEEISLITESALLVSKTLAELASIIRPGITTLTLDKYADEYIRDNGATPSFYQFEGFPFHICTSVNSEVVHGFPNDRPLREGDIVSVDVGAYKNGYHGDQAYTFLIGDLSTELLDLVRVTKESLSRGIENAKHGNRTGDIGYAIQSHVDKFGFGIVQDLVGHGLGKELHEKPDVPNFGRRGHGKVLQENMVLAIEPMINLGSPRVYLSKDNWTFLTMDGKPSVHFEQDICVKKGSPIILTDFGIIENAEMANENLNSSYYEKKNSI